MKIVILDGYTINPGDLDWGPIKEIGELTIYDRTEPRETYDRVKDAEIIITSKVIIDKDLLDRLPALKYIGVIATGYNVTDLEYTKEKGIVVTNIPDYCSESVAQLAFALILEHARNVGIHNQSVKNGDWCKNTDFSYWKTPQYELTGRKLGLIGFGHIARKVAKIALAFDMDILAFDPHHQKSDLDVEFVELDKLFNESDIVSLHCPLNDRTFEIINTDNLSKMKKNAIIVNTGRGPLINQDDLAKALNESTIAGACLDVLKVEPAEMSNPLLKAKNCIITPHIAWSSLDARTKLITITADNIKAFMNGKPKNMVN